MKVVFFGNYALYFIPRLLEFRKKLQKEGSEMCILIASEGENILYSKLPQVDSSVLSIYKISDAPASFNYKEKSFFMLDKLNPDVVITGFISFPYGAAGLQWAKSRNKAIIEYDDQRLDTFPRSFISAWIKKHIIRNVDSFLCPAPAWDETLLNWGFKKDEIFYGLDTSDNDFWGTKVVNESLPNLPHKYFMTVGRQSSMKNLPKFVSAYLRYKKEGGTLPLVMVGEGPDHEILMQMSNEDPSIIFLPFQTRERIRELFVGMHALILPSTKSETWGMVVNECMASGGIVGISNECGSSTTLVLDEVNGFHFSPHSEEEMIKTLFKLERLTPERYSAMRSKSLEIIKDWGLQRFVDGAYNACRYALQHKKKVRNPIDYFLLNIWKGRYNVAHATK